MSIKYLYDRKKIAVTYGEQKYSYADVIKYVNYYSEFLDISKGDRVALMMENRPESIFSFFSIWAKKGIAISLDAGYTVDQLAFVLNDSKPKYIFVSNKVKEVVEKENIDYIELEEAYLYGEDFSFFSRLSPINYSFLGLRNEEKNYVSGLHTPTFNFDEKILKVGVKYYLGILNHYNK